MSLSAPTWDTSHAVRLFKEYAYKYRYCGPGDTTASIPIATIFPGDTPGRRASSLTKVNWQRSDFTGGGDSKMCSIIESMAIFSERSAFASSHETILLCAGLVMAVFLALLAVSAAAQFALLSGPLVKSTPALRFVMRSTSLSGVLREVFNVESDGDLESGRFLCRDRVIAIDNYFPYGGRVACSMSLPFV